MAIPNITGDFIPEIQKSQIKRKYKDISDIQFADEVAKHNINGNAFIGAAILKPELLTDEEWVMLKQLYIQWKLYEAIEAENVSKDKKESLQWQIEAINSKQKQQGISKAKGLIRVY